MKFHHHFFTWKHKLRPKLVGRLLMGLSLLLPFQHANALDGSVELTATAGAEYQSNPALAVTSPNPVWTTTLNPLLQIDLTDQLNTWFLNASVLEQQNTNQAVLVDRVDPTLAIGWNHIYESGFFDIRADYARSSSLLAQLLSTGTVTNTTATQTTDILSADWEHAINQRWSVYTEGFFEDTTYSVPGSVSSYKLGEISSTLTYAYTEKLDTSMKLSYAHYNPDVIFNPTDLVQLALGAEYQVNDGLTLTAAAGVYNMSGQQLYTNWIGGIKAVYTTERMNYTVAVSRAVPPSSSGGFRKTDSLDLGWLFDISERDQAGVAYGLSKSKKDSEIALDFLDYQQIGAFYNHTLSSHWQSNFYVNHQEIHLPTGRARNDVIGLSLVFDAISFK